MQIGEIVSRALQSVARTSPDIVQAVGYSCLRPANTIRGCILASVTDPGIVDPFSDDAAATSLTRRVLVFNAVGEGGWNHPFDPQIGDTFTIGGVRYSVVSVMKRYSAYYKVEVRSC